MTAVPAAHTAVTAGTTGSTVADRVATVAAVAADACAAEIVTAAAGVTAVATDSCVQPVQAGAAVTAVATVAEQASRTAGTAVGSGAANTAVTAVAQPTAVTASATGHTVFGAAPAGAAVTEDPAATATVDIGLGAIDTVADQAASATERKQRVDEVVDLRPERTVDPVLHRSMQRQIEIGLEPVGEISVDSHARQAICDGRGRQVIPIEQCREVERRRRLRTVPETGVEQCAPRRRIQQVGEEVLEVGVSGRRQPERRQRPDRRSRSCQSPQRRRRTSLKPT
ncbi:MAG: hypothetical protein M3Y90_00835 [Actinomycetota bacterium]|nr:hypothetical protein [Actinomycetota bacterium]